MTGPGSRVVARSLAALVLAAALLGLRPPDAGAQAQAAEFSFYGVKFGMTKAEVEQKWLPLSGGAYAVSSPAIRQIKPSFTHEGRLYEFTFSLDLRFPDDPAALVNIALQEALNEKWKKNAGIVVNLSIAREGGQVTVVSERLRDGYVRYLKEKMNEVLQP